MSAFVSMLYPDSVRILTDGAIYKPDGTLLAVKEKIWRAESTPMAITGRGDHGFVETISNGVIQIANASPIQNFDFVLVGIRKFFANMGMRRDELPSNRLAEFLIAGWSLVHGPQHFYVTVSDLPPKYGGEIVPFELTEGPSSLVGGYRPTLDNELATAGITPDAMKTSDAMERHGADIIEVMRRQKGTNPTSPDLPPLYGIGGHVQLTTITAEGATTKTLRTWPDRVGEKINPFAGENVIPMNRQQRRARERDVRRKARA